MERDRAVRISKLLALGLRHDPSALAITVDAQGWADVEAVLRGLANKDLEVSRDELEDVVETSDKQRYALSADGEKIRANQGHSIDVDLGLASAAPPAVLYHGTAARFLDSIRESGLVRGARTHVHLSVDVKTAEIVAKRRAGPHVILSVRASAMHEAGHTFFLSANGVWLTERVPPEFLEVG
jgi:putative RNA 2'-phosphotransferase